MTVKNDTIQKAKRGEKRMKKKTLSDETAEAKYYDERGALKEIIDEPVEMGLDTELRRAILSGKRRRNLKNRVHRKKRLRWPP